jgi:hypothetical protein
VLERVCVNFLGGPGSGKSVAAASLFVKLKKMHVNAEIVTEVAKDLVYENNTTALSNQILVFGKTLYKIQNAYTNTQVAVVDSPLLLSAIYNPNTSEHLVDLVLEQHKRLNNMNIFVRRDNSYSHSMMGRIHSLTESVSIDNQIINLLDLYEIPFVYYDELGEDTLIEMICEEIGYVPNEDIRQTRLVAGPVATRE